MAKCEICGKELKTTQGLRGHKTFVHHITSTTDEQPAARLGTEQQLSELDDRLDKLELITGVREQSALDRLMGNTDTPLTKQLSELAEQVTQYSEQVEALAEQVKHSHVTREMLSAYESRHARQLEQLRTEWEHAYHKLSRIIKEKGDLPGAGRSTAEDGTKSTNEVEDFFTNLIREHDGRA